MHVCLLYAWELWVQKRSYRPGVRDSWEWLVGVGSQAIPGPPEEQQVLLTTEPSLQLPIQVFKRFLLHVLDLA